MRRFVFIFFCFGLQIILVAKGFSQETTMAVLDFDNNSFYRPSEYAPLSKGLAEITITEMDRLESIRVVERRRLQAILDELKLSQSGIISEESSIQVGKMLGAKHILFGGYIVTMEEKIRIDVRIIDVETGLTVKAGEVTGKTKNILSLVKKLSKKILKDLDIKISKQEEKFLDQKETLNIQAVVLFSKGLESEDQGRYDEAENYYKEALKIESEFPQASFHLKQLNQNKY